MKNIELPDRISDNFGDPIQKIFDLIEGISNCCIEDEIVLDYSNAKFTHVFYSIALPLLVKIYSRRGYNIRLLGHFGYPSVESYMKTIKFPDGLDPLYFDGDVTECLDQYRNKSYIPIIYFPTGAEVHVTEIRDTFLSSVNRLLVHICGLQKEMVTALMYLVDEAVNNVLHHAKDDKGYLFAQYFKSKGYVDLVVADIGQTLLDTYASFDKHKNEVTNHQLAMEAALAGKSTKSLDVDRGFGISTSKSLLTKGLNGKYFIYSGNVFNIHTSEINTITSLPETISWQGVFLALRIPVVPTPGFDPSKYYE